MNKTLNGWLVINKPLTLTSFQVVAKVRHILKIKKLGHAGTLDPLATGVLPLALGEATKLIPYVMNSDKTYEFTLHWGVSTTTDDAEGETLETSPLIPKKDEVLRAIPYFLGSINQMPPKYSAIKVNGKRAYALARQNKDFSLKERPVIIKKLDLLKHTSKESSFSVTCSKGTYIRSLARDIAEKCKSVGHVSKLHRVQVGPFLAENAILLEYLEKMMHKEEALVISPLTVLDDIPALVMEEALAWRVRHGQKISLNTEKNNGLILPDDVLKAPVFKCLSENNNLIALAKIEEGCLKVIRGFNFKD